MNTGAGKRILAEKDQFIKMWKDNVSSTEMAYHFKCNNSTINIYAKTFGLDRRFLCGDYTKHFEEISQDELERRCEEVRSGWDEQTEFSRRVQKDMPLTVRHMLWTENGFADNGAMEACDMIGLENFNKKLDDAGHKRSAYNVFNK